MAKLSEFTWATEGDEVVKLFADSVKGRTFLITGPSVGSIGAETAFSLARGSPAQLILLGRDESKISPVIDQINQINPAVEAIYVPLDLSNDKSIRTAAQTILSHPNIKDIDVYINNAGVMACPYIAVEDWKDDQGRPLESQFSTNHLGHFLLTNLLLQNQSGKWHNKRIVNVSSAGHRFAGIRFDDVGYSLGKKYEAWDAYAQSKTANILMTRYIANKVASDKITGVSVHPGSVPTPLGRYMTPDTRSAVIEKFPSIPNMEPMNRKSLQQGCSTTLVAALDPSLLAHSGEYLADCHLYPAAPHAQNKEYAEELWALSEKIVGQQFIL